MCMIVLMFDYHMILSHIESIVLDLLDCHIN